MSKILVMIFTSVILATILRDHSVQCQRSPQRIPRSEIPCSCTLYRNNIITVQKQHSSDDGLYVCKKDVSLKKTYRKRSGNILESISIPF